MPADGRAEQTGTEVRSYTDATRRWVPLVIVGGLLGVAAIAASVATPGVHSVPIPHDSADGAGGASASATALPSLDGGSGGARQVFSVPGWASWIGGLAAAAFVITVVAVLVWHFIRNHWLDIRQVARDADRSGEAMSARREDVIAALDEGIARLAGDGDARSAVIACWVRLEEVAQAAGTPRALSDAPADLVTRLLGAHHVSTATLTSLADLYRAARYSTTVIDNSMRERALSALSTIRGQLEVSSSTIGPSGFPLRDSYVSGADDGWRR
jgi:hypothetical protein